MKPYIAELASDLLDAMERREPPLDLSGAFSTPLCSQVICKLLGVPEADIQRFRDWTEQGAHASDAKRSMSGIRGLLTYVNDLIRHRKVAPNGDIVSELLGAEPGGRDRLHEGRVSKLVAGMLAFGRETPASAIDLGATLLMTHPEQLALVHGDPDLVPSAVEEVFRMFKPPAATPDGLLRYAHTDVDHGGVTFRAGDMVLLDIAAANFDPVVFPDPERFDITRKHNPHLSFGFGSYMCNFSTLARAEVQIALRELTARFPDLHIADDPSTLAMKSHLRTGGLARLPVAW